ncbi:MULTISPECIES: SSI family serine proteinase inhibitor [unclassified Streptomyces]|uniref:SSI family serine proteinase inhibitor n=1 Tax=unclassified Streptomyces TaxID=2593676 RepID=UPI0035DA4A83
MKKITITLAALALATGLASAATAAPPAPTTQLQLTAERTEDGHGVIGFVWLDCPAPASPERLPHPHREEACAALDAADGDLDALTGEPSGRCTAEYAPVTLSAQGTYRGHTVDWTRTYPNNCEAHVRTSPLFHF